MAKSNHIGESDPAIRRWQIACGILFVAFLATTGWAIYQDRNYEKYVNLKLTEYPFIDFSRNFIPQEHFVANVQPLRESIFSYIEENNLQYSVTLYFEVLQTGANIIVNPDMRVHPASLLKVPTAMATMKKVERGEWSLRSKLVLFEEDVDVGYGKHYADAIGTTYTIEDLLRLTLIESDNTANKILLRNLTIDELAETLDAMGLNDVLDEDRLTTTREYSRIFRALYYSSYLQRASSQRLLEWLTESRFSNYAESGMPDDTPFAHKIGEDDSTRTYLDSGIAYVPSRPYLLTIAIVGEDEEEALGIMRDIARMTHEYVSTY